MEYPSQYDNKLEVNTDNNFKIRCHNFDWESAMLFEPVIMEYKR